MSTRRAPSTTPRTRCSREGARAWRRLIRRGTGCGEPAHPARPRCPGRDTGPVGTAPASVAIGMPADVTGGVLGNDPVPAPSPPAEAR